MRLYFLRHGIAEDRNLDLPDARRRLTDEGIAEMRGVAQGIRALGLDFDAIRTSPLVRARETAEIVAKALDAEKRLEEDERLACGCSPADLEALTAGLPPKARVLLVGHEPDMSGLVEALTGGTVRMKKSSLACVDWAQGARGGELRWLLEAEHLCRIGESRGARI